MYQSACWLGVWLLVGLHAVCGQRLGEITFHADMNNFGIKEDVDPSISVYTLNATSNGDEITYAILNSNTFELKRSWDGKVYLIKTLDYENILDREVTATVVARNERRNTELSREIRVIILDANDNDPKFASDTYSKSLPENTPVGTTVLSPKDKFYIEDVDGVNKVLTVTCDPSRAAAQHTDACNFFELVGFNRSNNYWYGWLVLIQPIDYEVRSQFQVPIVAFDGENNPLNTVEITVINIQDTPPRWIKAQDITVIEEKVVGTLIGDVLAIDGDVEERRPIFYEIIDTVGIGHTLFRIDNGTGQIFNTVVVDRESPNFLQGYVDLNIRARERDPLTGELGDATINSTTTQIRITVEDINDNKPQFEQDEYITSLREDAPNDTPLNLLIPCRDPDQGINNNFIFTLSAYNAEFKLSDPGNQSESAFAQIRVKDTSLIDYEEAQKQYVFFLQAQEFLTAERYRSETKVIVNIIDVNDNSPKFIQSTYVKSILETSPPGFSIETISATDPDSGDLGKTGIVYGMTGDGKNLFQLDARSGLVTVADCSTPGSGNCIDFDKKRQYVLTVTARDENGRGRAGTTTLTINILDVNDNAPVFVNQNYTSYIEENKRKPNPEVIVSALDKDTVGGTLAYSVIADQTGIWAVNSSGYIYANRDVIYTDTPGNVGFFVFQVQVTDGVFSPVSNVKIFVVDINDNTPLFPPAIYETTISESTPGGTSVITVSATDGDSPTTDNGVIDYTVLSGTDGKFIITRTTGLITTTPDSTFDYDVKKRYVLLVLARDRGTPPLNSTKQVFVNIRDVNNKDPYFVQSTMQAEVYENVVIGYSVITVVGRDPDANAVLNYFFVEPKTAFSPLGNNVDRNVYDFTNLFRVEQSTGIVRTNSSLDRDLTSVLTYSLIVVDVSASPPQTGSGTLIITVLEYNDQAPYFLPFTNQTIDEEQPFGTFVMVLQARDQDDAIAEYQIIDNPNQFFDINFQTGTVSIARRIDFEVIESTYFTAMVFDTGIPRLSASTTVYFTINNINDNSPKFQQSSYITRIPEHSLPGTFVIQVSATDIDKGDYGVVRYTLGEPSSYFEIDNITGDINVKAGANLDRETIGDVNIQVTAYDSPNTPDISIRRFATTTVYVYLDDINDNKPRFSQAQYSTTIVETIPMGTSILQVRASDLDLGLNALIAFEKIPGSGDINELFRVSRRSGAIEIQQSLLRNSGVYTFNVTATDMDGNGPFTAMAGVKITVLQATNSYPEWRTPPFANMSINVLESQYLGMLVYDVHASDSDRGVNGMVDYGFYHNGVYTTATPEFMINSITGVIRAQRVYDREEVDRYVLLLSAKDRGTPSLESTRFLTVVILDVNDNPPVFPVDALGETIDIEVQVPENANIGTLITRLLATDRDFEAEAVKIYYYIISGNEGNKFFLNKTTGELFLSNPLDRETKSIFLLDIQATNNVSDYSVITNRRRRAADPSIVTVKILVGDTNDAKPTFTKVLYSGCVSTRSAIGQSIIKVQAIDVDSTDIKYSITTGNSEALFVIDEITGIISNRVLMSNTNNQVYNLQVQARDSNLQDNANVQIFVTQPENGVTLVITQPASEVRLFKEQIQKLLESFTDANNQPIFTFVCFNSISDHVLSSGDTSSQWADAVISTGCATCGFNGGAGVYSGSQLLYQLQILQSQNSDGFDLLYINDLKLATDKEDQFDRTPTLVVMILIIVLLVVGLIFLIIACYCIRKSTSNEQKTALLETRTEERFEQPPQQNVNPMYDNYAYQPETVTYAKVVKKHQEPERPKYPEPELQLEFQPEYIEEPEPIIVDEVLTTEYVPQDPSPRSSEIPSEMRIETTIDDNDGGRASPEEPAGYRIETSY
ncbi:LOW QUALITY PROTEIN: cadherin-23-like [Pecten maximus]|uniref:LOW QUALITY PROTEIN: cadherin-23-like n=1 Tax=Pecten maximus TaxID=6579 RepID=UPI0014587698|nr:LOW QUALITY PROTEIN: cadherin-23-like [Pecten maximus]